MDDLIPLLVLVGEERACGGLDDPPTSGVLLQRLLQGPHEQVALGPIVEDHAKPGVYVAVLVGERLFRRRDVGFLAAQDIERISCVVSDLLMPGVDGLAMQQVLHAKMPHLSMVSYHRARRRAR